jgi:hypothetical protein
MKNIAFSKAWVIVFCSIAGLTSSSNAGERASGEDLEHRNYITDGVDRPLTIRNNAHWKIIAKDISSPIAVTCDHKQNVYIADDWKRCVYKFAPNGSKTIWWQGKGNQLPTRLAIDADDNLYVADKQGGTVHMVTFVQKI